MFYLGNTCKKKLIFPLDQTLFCNFYFWKSVYYSWPENADYDMTDQIHCQWHDRMSMTYIALKVGPCYVRLVTVEVLILATKWLDLIDQSIIHYGVVVFLLFKSSIDENKHKMSSLSSRLKNAPLRDFNFIQKEQMWNSCIVQRMM